ncbi:MAG: Inositol 2-dehydrogenase [Alphaproteobacteria bacterium MarineAlpha11_Bin1]|nr:MAG: Inositol 2-dehydrogenase [Alphaproteobacteria bacterium MarineAlpha11_Bin1]|tara:strand:- start:4074 stop:6242 length:2169 start_codon:yes stop_codon:yes gene_type:complete
MKQVIQSARSGKLALKEVPEARVRAGHLLVQTKASLISAGTERMVVKFAQKSLLGKAKARPDLVKKVIDKTKRDGLGATMRAVMARLDQPLPLGYSAAGIVVEVGTGLEGKFRVGQRVAMAGAGLANHAELNTIPANLCAPVPDDVNDEEACFGTLGAIAMNGVRLLEPQLGDVIGVIGVGLVGQLAVQFADLAGCRVIALDYSADRLKLAEYGGAELAYNLGDGDPTASIMALSSGRGCDGVVIAAATDGNEPFDTAATISRDRGKISLIGLTGTEFDYRTFMRKELSIVVSRSYGPGRYDPDYENRNIKFPVGFVRWTETRNLEETVRLMSRRRDHRLEVEQMITHKFPFLEAEHAYEMVAQNTESHLGVILEYDFDKQEMSPKLRTPVSVSRGEQTAGKCILGVIGAGNFARTVLLPCLKKIDGVELHTLVTERGISAGHSEEVFGFIHSDTDDKAVFENADINAVLIATPHSTHAELTTRALETGKAVLVEKPLALDREQLNTIIRARLKSDAFFSVGFNRRFAPMAVQARNRLSQEAGTKYVLLRVNAGQLSEESWQNEIDEGNGRILGEVCHFVDLARFLVGKNIKTVQASAASVSHGDCDDLTVSLNFSDGSLATIAYTALGDPAYSKELIEAFAGGTVININDFRSMTVTSAGKEHKPIRSIEQDKGHAAELEAFARAVAAGGAAPADESEIVETSFATIAVIESLQRGSPVDL